MFEKAKWIAASKPAADTPYDPSPYIAGTFVLRSVPAKAVLNICGYGEAVYYLNGKEIPDGLRPTVPSTTPVAVVYNVYDLTPLLRAGKNRLGILLAQNRCFAQNAHPKMERPKTPEVIFELDIVYPDGSGETVVSDTSFRSHGSHILHTGNVCGEIHDHRFAVPGWCDPDFDDSDWTPVREAPAPGGEYRPAVIPPIRRFAAVKPKLIAPGLYDFGVTTSGYVRTVVNGKAGSRVRVQYAERLTDDCLHVDMSAFLKEKRRFPELYNTAEFILDGSGNETFEELFAIHGFRYAEVTGEADSLSLEAVTVHTDMPLASSFTCSDETLNRLHQACVNSILTCTQGYFVDNPKRDAAWVGDQMLSAEAIAMNFDSYSTSLENMRMCRDAMLDNGVLPHVVPAVGKWNYDGFLGPDWTAGVIFHVPYFTYRHTGDRAIVDEMWESMERALDSFVMFAGHESPFLLDHGGTGDWSAVKPGCSLEVCMTAYYYLSARMMEELADATGRDSRSYRTLAENIRAACRAKYVENGQVRASHITEYILPAALGLLEEDELPAAVDRILAMIEEDNTAFTFGTHGMRMIYDLLSAAGHADVLWKVLHNDREKGFAMLFRQGYDTLPERFDADKDGIYSYNHHFLSGVDAWLYKWVAGIRVKGFALDDITIAPLFIDGLSSVSASLHGIAVSYDEKTVTVDSPYAFTSEIPNHTGRFAAGRYTFER